MAAKENLKSNEIIPTLFVGVGGIGGRTIKGVAKLCKNDKKDNIRFVIMDTDGNDLDRIDRDLPISTVQTSSTRNIKAYMGFDKDANDNWFPNNRILDTKTVSEGAGQVRAISRLALNASIRQNKIKELYKAIDDLYLKNGSGSQRSIKVIVSSTATGGTGSGIAMEAAMIIRDYISTNYPESSAIIRGFFIMPGVMSTVIKSKGEMASQERNGYATIKEINAFMMKGSGFFESDERLKRYKGLCISVPTTNGGVRTLDNLPFDFCFLIEKNDSNQKSMQSLSQYEKLISQCIYEQNISILSKKASSQEDNVIKTFIDPKLLGRSRFGSVGAAVLRYPYESIRDYIAYSLAEKNILGVRNSLGASLEESLKNTWIFPDYDYKQMVKEYENGKIDEDPTRDGYRGEAYINSISASQSDFGEEIREANIEKKYNTYISDHKDLGASLKSKIGQIADQYIEKLAKALEVEFQKEVLGGGKKSDDNQNDSSSIESTLALAKHEAEKDGFVDRYNAIASLDDINNYQGLKKISKNFLKSAFESQETFSKDYKIVSKPCNGDDIYYSIENFVGTSEKSVLHPNAIRCILYSLQDKMSKGSAPIESDDAYSKKILEILYGATDGSDKKAAKNKDKEFQVKGNRSKEHGLLEMCSAVDEQNKLSEMIDSNAFNNAQDKLNEYEKKVSARIRAKAKYEVCFEGKPYIDALLTSYEKFYESFEKKIQQISKRKEDIITSIKFNNGDCVKNLFASKDLLDTLCDSCSLGKSNSELYVDIFKAIKNNALIEKKRSGNPLLTECTSDVFNDIIIENYKNDVEKNCSNIIDLDILQAIKCQYETERLVAAQKEQDSDKKEEIMRDLNNIDKRNLYIRRILENVRTLAAPSLSKANDDENREVSAMAYGAGVDDDNATIRIDDFKDYLDRENKSSAISKYELHCFRSIYGLTPNDISALKFVKPEGDNELFNSESGTYFKNYQDYMKTIGPDSRLTPVITPHVDKRWNSISIMPELDLDYQKMLMGHIHEAYMYGFVYGTISSTTMSSFDSSGSLVYCFDDGGKMNDLYVSDKTNCDELYKVVDSMYCDRSLVEKIHAIAEKNRNKTMSNPPQSFDDSIFAKSMKELKRSFVIKSSDTTNDKFEMSIFELPLLYYSSLPPKDKDDSELKTMVQGLMYAVRREIMTVHEPKDAIAIWKNIMIDHYKKLVSNHRNVKELAIINDNKISSVKEYILDYFNRDWCYVECKKEELEG